MYLFVLFLLYSELNWNLVFVEGGKRENLEKNSWSEVKNSAHILHRARIEPGPHGWEASNLTTAPSLLPKMVQLSC